MCAVYIFVFYHFIFSKKNIYELIPFDSLCYSTFVSLNSKKCVCVCVCEGERNRELLCVYALGPDLDLHVEIFRIILDLF